MNLTQLGDYSEPPVFTLGSVQIVWFLQRNIQNNMLFSLWILINYMAGGAGRKSQHSAECVYCAGALPKERKKKKKTPFPSWELDYGNTALGAGPRHLPSGRTRATPLTAAWNTEERLWDVVEQQVCVVAFSQTLPPEVFWSLPQKTILVAVTSPSPWLSGRLQHNAKWSRGSATGLKGRGPCEIMTSV